LRERNDSRFEEAFWAGEAMLRRRHQTGQPEIRASEKRYYADLEGVHCAAHKGFRSCQSSDM
jgi:hypothetical protein